MEISSAFTRTLDLEELLQLIADRAQTIVANADWVAIHLFNKEIDALELVAGAGLEIDARSYTVGTGQGIAGRVMETGEVLNIGDVQTDSRHLPIDIETNVRALIVGPVENRRGRIGTISMECATPYSFNDGDARLLLALGSHAGLAIENAQLYAAQEQARLRAERQRERLRAMARRVVLAQEEERARIARELHDESGQALTSLKIGLGLIRDQLPPEMAAEKQRLDELLALADTTMNRLRLLSHNLRPPGLDIYGLDAALESLCQDFQTHTQLEVIYTGDTSVEAGSAPELAVYRFAQEALTNVAKHAEATEVRVTLAREEGLIKLVVSDNGQGFTPPDQDTTQTGNGLLGMIERLNMVNGQMEISSVRGRGSCLTATIPDAGGDE